MKDKTLAIISDCLHIEDANGKVGTQVHIFCRQMQALGKYFKQVILICPVINSDAQTLSLSYYPSSFTFIKMPVRGGKSTRHKLQILFTIPLWMKAFQRVKVQADFFFLRFPNNISIPGIYAFRKQKKFALYTGTWKNYLHEPLSFRIQKILLRYFFNGPVLIYHHAPEKKSKFHPTYSPSYSLQEWDQALPAIEQRIRRWQMPNHVPVFLSVGSLLPIKNHLYTLEVFKKLKEKKIACKLIIVGDGFLKSDLQKFIDVHQLSDTIKLAGHLPTQALKEMYLQSDFIIQLPLAEGFGKVPMEGFFYGLIPFISNTAMASSIVGVNNERGFIVQLNNASDLADIIWQKLKDTHALEDIMSSARMFAKHYTLENWAHTIIKSVVEKNV